MEAVHGLCCKLPAAFFQDEGRHFPAVIYHRSHLSVFQNKAILCAQDHRFFRRTVSRLSYVEAREAMEKLLQEAGGIREEALRAILKQSREEEAVTVFNSLSFARKALVTLPDAFDRGKLPAAFFQDEGRHFPAVIYHRSHLSVFQKGACLADGTVLPVEHTFEGLKTLVELPLRDSFARRMYCR